MTERLYQMVRPFLFFASELKISAIILDEEYVYLQEILVFMLRSIIIVGFGGFIGTVARFLVARYFQENVTSVFPWGTFLVNVVGCFIIGVIYGLTEKGDFLTPNLRLFLTVGFCGGFTTFSSLANDAFILMRQEEWLRFAIYTSFSFFIGLLAVYAGRILLKFI